MFIKNSSIAMNSVHAHNKTSITSFSSNLRLSDSVKGNKNKDTPNEAKLSLSNQGRQLSQSLREKLRQLEQEEDKTEQVATDGSQKLESKDELNLEVLKRLLETLKRLREGKYHMEELKGSKLDWPKGGSQGVAIDLRSRPVVVNNTGNTWTRVTEFNSFTEEHEVMAFTSTGSVETADGKNINFNISIGMSRSFVESSSYIKEETVQIMTDPLVINLDTKTANVTDQTFLFDLNCDGEKDNISMLQEGSGFLALDKNSDGVINDGSELFGTKSGDGFKDLAEYDKDHNQWIDEADEVYLQLRVWTKDAEGNDKLINLKDANVGAIFLGNASSEFSLNDEQTNEAKAKIQSTGIYLKESGEVSTIQHVDFAL